MPVKKSIRQLADKNQKSKIQVKTPTSVKASAGKKKLEATRKRVASKVGGTSRVGLSVDVYDVKGKVVGKTSLPKEIFAAKINPVLMAQAVRVYLANQRKGTASTKTRGEVRASTRKIWRQKGTGRARHGALSAPIFVGGGVAFGPKPRDYSLSLPKKMKRLALASALTSKIKDEAVKVIDGLEKLEAKTKVMYGTLEAVTNNDELRTLRPPSTKLPSAGLRVHPEGSPRGAGRTSRSGQANNKILLILPGKIENVQRAARNIEGVTIRPANLLTTYEVLSNDRLLFMKDAVEKLEELWTKQAS